MLSLLRSILQLEEIEVSPELKAAGASIWDKWSGLVRDPDHILREVKIALVGKYTKLHDSYLSVVKALEHSAMHCGVKLSIIWIDSENLEHETENRDPAAYHTAMSALYSAEGIVIPGGYGKRGITGKIQAPKLARVKKIPVLGI